jgi:septal ring factor EnvC (AmiA/AmiB activator)
MPGVRKSRQEKGVDGYIRSQGGEAMGEQNVVTYGGTGAPRKNRGLVGPTIVAAVLLLLCFISFARIDRLDRELAPLRAQADKKVIDNLKGEIAALNARLDKSGSETEKLKADIARLEADLDAMKAAAAQAPRAGTKRKRAAN